MYADSAFGYRNDIMALSNYRHKYNESIIRNSRIERCLDINVLDDQFDDACCGLEGYSTNCTLEPQLRDYNCPIDEFVDPPSSFHPLGKYISDPMCLANASDWVLQDARFDCQVIEDSCSIAPCNGVNEDLIRSMSIEADCLVQLYLIRCLKFILLLLYHAISINVFCGLILEGLKILLWGQLVSDRANIVATEDFKHRQSLNERVEKIQAETWKRELQGRLKLSAGLFSFLLWIISFFLIGKVLDV
jgi:hypothetical protein